MNEDELLRLLSDPSVHPEEKKKLLSHLQDGNQRFDWPTTIAGLATDAAIGTYGAHAINKWKPSLGDTWHQETGWRRAVPKGESVRNLLGALSGGGIGLAGALGYKAIENYLSPLRQGDNQ